MKPSNRMLFFPAEAFPTNRVRLTLLFGRELLSRGHEIDFVMQAHDDKVLTGRHECQGRSIWVIPTDVGEGFLHRLRKHMLRLWHEIRWLGRASRSGYSSILVSDKYLLGAIAAIIARVNGQKSYFWLTFPFHRSHVMLGKEGIVRYPRISVIRGHLERLLLFRCIVPLSHHIFVQSPRMAEEFSRDGADPAKMTPILTGVDLKEIVPVNVAKRTRCAGTITIGYLGTLARERRLEILIDMLANLSRRGVTARLLLVGDGEVPEDRSSFERHARMLGVADQVEITGYMPRLQAIERIKDADICVSPIHPSPIFDGASPTKLVEYMALGLPVVANAHPDQSHVLRSSRAGVCVPWGARHFARAVSFLAKRSDEELAALGGRGRAWVEVNRSYSVIADSFERACLYDAQASAGVR